MSIESSISQIGERIGRHQRQSIGEQNTKSILIEPMLRALGWDVEDLDEVRREYRPTSSDNPVDYVLFSSKIPRLYVEAKGLGENLDDRKWAHQIMGYASVTGVEWVVLTDGNEYRIYNAHAGVPIEDKLFRKIRITDNNISTAETLTLLSKPSVETRRIDTAWKAFSIDRQLLVVMASLTGEDPDPAFLKFLRQRIPGLSNLEIRNGLQRTKFQVEIRPHSANDPEPADSIKVDPPGGQYERSEGIVDANATPWRSITLRDLIEQRLLPVPISISRNYKGHALTGRIIGDRQIIVRDREFESLSTAAGFARALANGTATTGKFPATNGWGFWKFQDTDGSMKDIDVLRQRLFDRRN